MTDVSNQSLALILATRVDEQKSLKGERSFLSAVMPMTALILCEILFSSLLRL